MTVVLVGVNALLGRGLREQTGAIGSPVPVNVWRLLGAIFLAVTGRDLRRLLQPA